MKNLIGLSISILILMAFYLSGCGNSNSQSDKAEKKIEEKSKSDKVKFGWQIAKVVDEFGDEVEGKGTILGLFEGEMSNSATKNAILIVKVQIGDDDKSTFISFSEYASKEGQLPEKKIFKIKIKKEDESTEFIEQFSMKNMMTDTKGILMDRILAQDSPLKVNVDLSRSSKYESTIYNFAIDPDGLRELLDKN